MAQLRHPFLVNLHATYKDKNRLFFLLEVVQGGELFSVLREKTLFDEDTAKFFAASVLLAFEYMHSMNIVYRDLKVRCFFGHCGALRCGAFMLPACCSAPAPPLTTPSSI